ncbi:MAG TPA: hypothetical protein ENJ27_02165, partial [Candidatus Moranbacteria bacterium]|nr:hypothetical protein [Candidatus Moranbacteria bacterium]
KEKYGAEIYRFSDVFRKILDILGLEQNRKNMSDLSLTLRTTFGEDVLAKAIAEEVKKTDKEIIIVDGVRRIEDIKYLKEITGFKLVFVDADLKNRYERLIKRGENLDDDNKTFEEFKKDAERNAELKISTLKDYADEIIDNNKDIQNFYQQINGIFK